MDAAERHDERTLILRHGKPAAAIVPVAVAVPAKRGMSAAAIEALFAGFSGAAPEVSAVDDLVAGRR